MCRECVRVLIIAFIMMPWGARGESGALSAATEFHAYMRLGFNTSPNIVEEPSDTQGYGQFGDQPTSRHVHRPNYFWLSLQRTLDSGARGVVKLDNEANLLPHETNHWGVEGDAEAQMPRVRDLYLQLPAGSGNSLWAGSRFIEFEDIRLFDYLNHFNLNGYGLGGTFGKTLMAISMAKDEDSAPRARKNATILARHEIALIEGLSLKPMMMATRYGATRESEESNATVGSLAYSVGGVLSRWGQGDWGNTHFWMERRPVDTTGKKTGEDMTLALGDSASFTLTSELSLLTACLVQQERFAASRQVYTVNEGHLTAKDGARASVTHKIAVGAQPIYRLKEHLFAAVDLQATYKTVKLSNTDFNQTLVTPILRYSLDQSSLGNPQIYTSLTWGHYDFKAKRDGRNTPTDTLVTTQTGMEVWF